METVHIQTVIGSVFGNVTQYISGGELNAQKQELNVGGEQPSRTGESAEGTEQTLPEAFATAEASHVLEQLVAAGLTDARWQPIGLSYAEKGVLAAYLAHRLGIQTQWQRGMKPETLRTAFNKALDKTKSLAFQDRLKALLRE